MAFINRAMKKQAEPAIKAVLIKYNMMGKITIYRGRALVVTLLGGSIDFNLNSEYATVNTSRIEEDFTGIAAEFLSELANAMKKTYCTKYDFMLGKYYGGWFVNIAIGHHGAPYQHIR